MEVLEAQETSVEGMKDVHEVALRSSEWRCSNTRLACKPSNTLGL